MFTTLRFFLAVATGGTMVTSFVLTMELIGAKYRATVGIIYQIPFNLGHLSLPLFGYFLRNWDMFQLAISLPSILFLSYYFLLPESPRWLITVGKTEEAVKIMETAAKRSETFCNSFEEQFRDLVFHVLFLSYILFTNLYLFQHLGTACPLKASHQRRRSWLLK